jgi:1-deoxy-D-xylulose-5-phosphate reductoisomerase
VRDVVILGSTGSIGVQALEIVAAHPDLFRVVALSAGGKNTDLLVEQTKRFKVPVVGLAAHADQVRDQLPGVTVIDGAQASTEIAAITCDIVLNAITGSIGLGPTLAALKVGNTLALANKESLVAGGEIVMSIAKPGQLLPVDSEHSALYQALKSGKRSEVSRLVLTASGGPFRDRDDLATVTVAEALAHPTWTMGPVVTINSATLVNKGLEIIEAHYLFDIPYSQIEAVIHPQSVVHSFVEFIDGSTIAQASPPNMKGPIAYALAYPDRLGGATAAINWSESSQWIFSPIDHAKFPAVDLARRCGTLGGGLPAIFNAANEVAVAAFLDSHIGFSEIIDIVDAVVQQLSPSAISPLRDLADVSAIEDDARLVALEKIKKVAR